MVLMRQVRLREIRGEDELAELSARELVERLTKNGPEDLSLSEQDQVLADVYRAVYGGRVECHVECVSCGRSFEMSFSLDEWLASLATDGPQPRLASDGVFELEDGLRFRLPCEQDLARAAGQDEAEIAASLRRLCVVEGDPDDPRLEPAMARVGPLLDDEIEANCAYCGQAQLVPFRLADYLLASLTRERPLVSREVHYLARAYHWSRSEILSMPRSQRREHVALVLSEAEEEGGW